MPEAGPTSVSIIIPTYNEEEDIARTMDALAAIPYRPLEVIVVDASRDRTPEIIRSYVGRIPGLKLIRQGPKPGVSAARNDGLRAASGDIVVILNGDVFPSPDFVDCILAHYAEGADYLVINSRVLNTEHLYPRFIQAQHLYNLELTWNDTNWSEGFSCRREAALAVGAFPDNFAHNTAGEDAIFGNKLAAHYKRAADFSIVVPHVMPTQFKVYWRQRLGRGRGGAYVLYVYEQRPMRWPAILRSVIGTLGLTAITLPALIYAWRITRYSDRGVRDLLPFTWARMIETAATAVGYWDGCREIARNRAKASS
jgi:glycosyltransferase involved in cell wall biosynthesis